MRRGEEHTKGAAIAAALLLGVPAAHLLFGGGTPGPLHAVLAVCGLAFAVLSLKEA